MDRNDLHEQVVQFGNHSNKYEIDQQRNPLKSTFIYGPSSIRQSNYGGHPLERLEKTRLARDEYRDLQILRSVQGIQAPLRQLAERKSAANVGRLPFLPSSNLMMDVLLGHDEMIMPENIYDQPNEFCEVNLPPHMIMERKLNIL
ncbi:hypothetical protein DERP_003261 [Dermatophagoides pteronyssinus]|uniref:Uncharacterized protein n=2 Tax=Dermatophagoides pteronyssinus TaxID=6956 RepID=A0ABQ8JIZ9_DERPT|nr:proteasome maturation protein-like [Dermatophagoides pteronyssinus]KAH9422584.1 hypothetical protein DERP_003261 [Dermatophagoides pteronyssinus]